MWMPKRTSPELTPVLSPALGAGVPGAPGVGAGAGAALDPPPEVDPPPPGVGEAALGAAAAVESVLPPPDGAALEESLLPGRRAAAPFVSCPLPPPQAVRVRARAARSDTPRMEFFIVAPPSLPAEPVGPPEPGIEVGGIAD